MCARACVHALRVLSIAFCVAVIAGRVVSSYHNSSAISTTGALAVWAEMAGQVRFGKLTMRAVGRKGACPIHFHSAQSWLPRRVRYPYHPLLTAYEPANQLTNQPTNQSTSQPPNRLCICLSPVIADRGNPPHKQPKQKQKHRVGWHWKSIKLRFANMRG